MLTTFGIHQRLEIYLRIFQKEAKLYAGKLRWVKAQMKNHRGNDKAGPLEIQAANPGEDSAVADAMTQSPFSIMKSKIHTAGVPAWTEELIF